MPYQQELDDARREIRRGGAGMVRFWPKVDGRNVLATDATAQLYSPTGAPISTPAVTNQSIGDPPVSRLSVPVSGLNELGEGYRIDFAYSAGGVNCLESATFDVVTEPLGTIGTSLNDLVSEQADIAEVLDRLAQLQGDGRTAADQAQVVLHLATQDVRAMLRRKVEAERREWPQYLPNKEELRSVVVAAAIERTQPAGSDLRKWWREERQRRFDALPTLRYSTDGDRVANASLDPPFGSVKLRRR